jgi:histidinol dehydrogenase
MKIIRYPGRKTWKFILKRAVNDNSALRDDINLILKDIKFNGDSAVRKYTEQFDQVILKDFRVNEADISEAVGLVNEKLKSAITTAKNNIEAFHKPQLHESKVIETTKGVKCWQKSVPIEKVGIYIPGGSAPLFSTVLMLGLPSMLAGCKEIIMCSPPSKDGKINPVILYTAQLIGITKIFKAGGVQAIGSMAYGTETIPKVYKIFGPGNNYVTLAKQLVSLGDVAIDMPAGPSEVAVIADENADSAFIASDLLSQAEHGPDSQVLLVTSKEEIIKPVQIEINKQVRQLPRKEIALKALSHSMIILMTDDDQIIDLINEYAPEHLIINTKNYRELSERIVNAGSVFLGQFTSESAGDYASGTNHTLPTNGFAKSYSGVNMDSFMKKITYQEIDKDGLLNLGETIEIMAEAEQLIAHKNAITLRLKSLNL